MAVVTGAGGVLGRTICVALARRGASILAVDRAGEAAQEAALAVREAGGDAEAHEADVTREDEVAGYVARALERFGHVDWFANNAGIEGPAAELADFPSDGFEQVMAVNVFGVFLGLKHVLPALRANGGGSVVNTASVAGLFGTPRLVAYGASKHAVIGITRTAALETARENISVNAVCPGPQESRMMDSIESRVAPGDPGGARASYTALIPMGRYGRPQEVGDAVAWLLADAPRYLTGQTLVIDGGLLAA